MTNPTPGQMILMEISIPTPRGFSFKRTAISHGWYGLRPFELDQLNWTLARVIDLGEARPVTVKVSESPGAIKIKIGRKLGKRAAEKVARDVRHILRLDDDLMAFYEMVAKDSDFGWIASAGAGRMLRSPTVFEDLVKTICTTNC
ncbi:MAG TPA: hypothetical protein VNI02_20535, partial [Blastocatellia bacterium]|nr:hypothetical protein [Blastocatellia bacterium]